jgi:hypothetical protein
MEVGDEIVDPSLAYGASGSDEEGGMTVKGGEVVDEEAIPHKDF